MFEKVLQISGAAILLLSCIFGYVFGFTEIPGTPDSIDLELGSTPSSETIFLWPVALTWWMNGFFWGMVLIALSYIIEKLNDKTSE